MALAKGISMSELELKFQVPKEVLASLQRELKRRGARSTPMLARYFDTPDGDLDRHGLSLRLRREGGEWVQTLKAEGASAVDRLEHNAPLSASTGLPPELDMARHQGTEAGAALEEALADARVPELLERYVTDVMRLACELRPGGAEVEAALDLGTIRANGRAMPICELGLEHKSGDSHALFSLATVWSEHGGLWLNTLSKSRRGTALANGHEHGPPLKASDTRIEPGMDGSRILRTVLQQVLRQVLGNASEVAFGSTDADHVHQMRVGLRRLRTALRELGPLAEGVDPGWEAPMAEAFSRLGTVRDSEVVAEAVRPLLEQAEAPKLKWSAPAEDVDVGALARDPRLQGTLLAILAFASGEPPADASALAAKQAREHVCARLSKLHRQVVKGGQRFEELAAVDQHKVRKRLKRLRYLAEFVQALWPTKATRRYLRQLGPGQDALGAHNDVAVALEQFREDAHKDPRALFAAGYLQAHLATTAREAHAALKKLAETPRFWKE